MKEGTIVGVTPRMDGEEQRSWTSTRFPDKPNYVYDIEFDNGDKGEVSGKKEGDYTYSVGTKVNYEIEEGRYGMKISKVKPIKEAGGGGGTYNDPTNNLRMAMSTAQEYAIDAFIKFAPDVAALKPIQDMSDFFYSWITDSGKIVDRDILSKRWYALSKSIKCLDLTVVNPKNSEEIIQHADTFLESVIKVVHEK